MKDFNDNLVVGIVAHVSINDLKNLKETIEELPYLKIIFFKTSSEKLWIKEESEHSGY